MQPEFLTSLSPKAETRNLQGLQALDARTERIDALSEPRSACDEPLRYHSRPAQLTPIRVEPDIRTATRARLHGPMEVEVPVFRPHYCIQSVRIDG